MGRRALQGALRVSLARSVQPRPRSGDGARVSRRDTPRGRSEGRPLLLDVRAEVLFDEHHAGRASVRGQARDKRVGDARHRPAGQGGGVMTPTPGAQLDLWTPLARLREAAPLVHNITNYVVMNNTANALL